MKSARESDSRKYDLRNSFVSEICVFCNARADRQLPSHMLHHKHIKHTFGRITSNESLMRLWPDTEMNVFERRSRWSGAFGLYGMWQKFPYVIFETRVRTK